MEGFLIIAGLLVFVIGVYILTYYFNQKTEAPEGVEQPGCESCHNMSCSLRKKGGPKDHDEIEECEIVKLD